jgi:uncharacterized membrane protein YphA (DoxX/SURF4 family)
MLSTGAYTWFAKVIVFGELAIGIALILGAFTGIAAFGGGFLNWNFIMAGTASTNALPHAESGPVAQGIEPLVHCSAPPLLAPSLVLLAWRQHSDDRAVAAALPYPTG